MGGRRRGRRRGRPAGRVVKNDMPTKHPVGGWDRPYNSINLFLMLFDQECQRMSKPIAENRLANRLNYYARAVQVELSTSYSGFPSSFDE